LTDGLHEQLDGSLKTDNSQSGQDRVLNDLIVMDVPPFEEVAPFQQQLQKISFMFSGIDHGKSMEEGISAHEYAK